MITLILSFFLIVFIISNVLKRKFPRGMPPGITGLPIIGATFRLDKETHLTFLKWRKKFGDIFSFDFGTFNGIILHDYKMIRDAMNNPNFAGRPVNDGFVARCQDLVPRGILFNTGVAWSDQRRFVMKALRDFGLGRKSMDKIFQEEVQELIESIKKDGDSPVNMQGRFIPPVINSLWAIVASEKFPHDDKRLLRLIETLEEDLPVFSMAFVMPWLIKMRHFIPIVGPKVKLFLQHAEEMNLYMKNAINEHKKSYQEGQNRDVMDAYIEEVNKTTDPNSSFYKEEGYINFMMVLHDLFLAGAETTSTALSWTTHLCAVNPKVQAKLHAEIDRVIGKTRIPSLYDRPNMPYVEALIMETLRKGNIAPSGVLHKAIADVPDFYGYKIPKDTVIYCNLYAVSHDEKVWGDPEAYRPERFLSDDEKEVLRNDALIPFQTGKRNCLGESLARDELFLFITNIFQRFQIIPHPNYPKPEKVKTYFATTNSPVCFPLKFIDRFE